MNQGFMEKVMTKVDLTGSQPKSEKRLTNVGFHRVLVSGLQCLLLASFRLEVVSVCVVSAFCIMSWT